jgi:DNA-binding winged helix-turn-helix (wHTH) protein
LVYLFDEYSLDPELRELRRGPDIVTIEPQVFDLLTFLIRNRGRVVSKDDLMAEVWNRRIVSDSTLSTLVHKSAHVSWGHAAMRNKGSERDRNLLRSQARS